MRELSKAIKRELRALVRIAYERELSHHLKGLANHFTAWEENKITC